MSLSKPSVPKGTRDFTPTEMLRRNYIFSTIREVFQRFGFLPIETPAMENLSTLMGKYGEEGDKLLFRILNSGDFLAGADEALLRSRDSQGLSSDICDRGLRYDLTVPFARFVVQHRNELSFPFRRYQIQPVWRADRPQKGRYREFYQCDADVIGSDSLLNEAELIAIIDQVFKKLEINIQIQINNRKILAGIAEVIGNSEKLTDLTVVLDKLDKTGKENVIAELVDRGFEKTSVNKLIPLIDFEGSYVEKVDFLNDYLGKSVIGLQGIQELQEIFKLLPGFGVTADVIFNLSLARGLNYYTGAIIEVKAKDTEMGSICGGGRYDDLTGVFGLSGTSGVGISFGADRIYDVMLNLSLFPEQSFNAVNVMFINFGKEEVSHILPLLTKIRESGINAFLYPDTVKMGKQMNYANSNNIPFVAIVGESEIKEGLISLKDMTSGTQEKLTVEKIIEKVKGKR